ncbi:MAG: methyltransferase domain-containing protein [Clostridia bacterium]|nr:methyltransferase domain-containing protein [Clostridia bacterium]
MNERVDHIGFGGYQLIQDPSHFCYGIDAVLLADFAQAKQNDCIVDLGTGTGVIPLILHHKSKARKIIGVEKQKEAYDLAVKNARLNNLTETVEFVHGDVVDIKSYFKRGEFSLVVTNPPYTEKGTGPISHNNKKETARHETTAGILEFVEAAHYLLAPKGSFCIVYRPSRLIDLLVACRSLQLEPKRIKFVAPEPDSAPNIVLVQCIKNGGKELVIEPTLFVRESNGAYGAALNRIYERISE